MIEIQKKIKERKNNSAEVESIVSRRMIPVRDELEKARQKEATLFIKEEKLHSSSTRWILVSLTYIRP